MMIQKRNMIGWWANMGKSIEEKYLQKCFEADLEATGIDSVQKHFNFRKNDRLIGCSGLQPTNDEYISILENAITNNGGKVVHSFYKRIKDKHDNVYYDFIFDYYGNFTIKTSVTWIYYLQNIDKIVMTMSNGTEIHPYRELKEKYTQMCDISSYLSTCLSI